MTGVSRYLLLECPSRRLQLLILSSFSIFNIVSSSGCYYAYNTTILSSPDYVDPCGPITSTTSSFLSCCVLQSNNICLSSSICYDANPIGGAYYLSPCTDKTYSAPECPQYCSQRVDKNQLDVVYDSQSQIWRCCGTTEEDGSADCTNPTDETFSAPPPSSLSTIYPTTRASSLSSFSSSSSLSLPSHKTENPASSSAPGTFNASPSSSLYSVLLPSSRTEAAASSSAQGTSNASTPIAPSTASSNSINNSNGGFGMGEKLALDLPSPPLLEHISPTSP